MSPRVQAVIEARLANLSPTGRELVAAGAVIGRAFDTELLAAVAGASGDDDALLTGLDELWQHGIIRARDARRSAGSYDFSHGTLRDVAAAALSPVRRTLLHRRVALALQPRAGESGAGSAEIAAHYAQAGDPAQAAEWYRRAAEAAQLLYAHADAVGLLAAGVGAGGGGAGSAARDAQELELRTALLAPLVSEQGYASPGVSRAAAARPGADRCPGSRAVAAAAAVAGHDRAHPGRLRGSRILQPTAAGRRGR